VSLADERRGLSLRPSTIFRLYPESGLPTPRYQYVPAKGSPLFHNLQSRLVATEREYLVAKQNQTASGRRVTVPKVSPFSATSAASDANCRASQAVGRFRKKKSHASNPRARYSRTGSRFAGFRLTSPSAMPCPAVAVQARNGSLLTNRRDLRPFGFQAQGLPERPRNA